MDRKNTNQSQSPGTADEPFLSGNNRTEAVTHSRNENPSNHSRSIIISRRESSVRKTSVFRSCLAVVNSIIGTGVLTLPNIIRLFGMILGSFIIIVSCLLTHISCKFLLKSRDYTGKETYCSIGKSLLGSKGLVMVKAILIINNVGVCVGYLIIFSIITRNLCIEIWPNSKFIDETYPYLFIFFASLWTASFIFAKSYGSSALKDACAIAVLSVIVFSCSLLAYSIKDHITINISVIETNISSPIKAIGSVASIFLAFTFQFNFFPIYQSLENPQQNMKKATSISLSMSLIIYLIVANCGYIAFSEFKGTLLDSFNGETNTVFYVMNGALIFLSTMTVPLFFFGTKMEVYDIIILIRKNIGSSNKLTNDIRQGEDEEESESSIERKYGLNKAWYVVYVITLFLLIVGMAMAAAQTKIEQVLSFIGSTAANGLSFFIPCLFYIKLPSETRLAKSFAVLMMMVSVGLGIIGVISIFLP